MKKIYLFIFMFLTIFMLSSCSSGKQKLYLLNWDEYIDEGLLDKFEEQYNCKVIMEIAESNEIMYSRIKTNSADYDIAIPSDYMISQMAQEDMLIEIDFDQLENFDEENLVPTLKDLIDTDGADIKKYLVPYFWGSLGIMYNTDIIDEEEFEERISIVNNGVLAEFLEADGKEANGWNILFDKELEAEIGMYATSRDSIASALLALGYSLNTTDPNELKKAEDLLKSMNYKGWSTDDLKVGVAGGKYSLALVYSGDYIDALYSLDDPTEANFKMYCPKDNNVFFDAMVIPKTSANTELAYKFIDFMINTEVDDEEDEEALSNAYANADAVGYCPTIESVLEEFLDCVTEYNEMSEEEQAEVDPADYYIGICDQDAYNPSDIPNGEVYQYLGSEVYDLYENIYKRVKSDTDEEEKNVSGYILFGLVILLVGGVVGKITYDHFNKNKKKYQ